MIKAELTSDQRQALQRIVGEWIYEGLAVPPYEDAYYDIFEWLDLANTENIYDTRRPRQS
jgi:hypothetical protein